MGAPHVRILPSIQILRGLAALAVALQHIVFQAGAGVPAWLAALPLSAGVDVFFVISGFVMVYSSAALFGRPGSARVFVGRRLARVVPLYWAATALLLAATLALPRQVSEPAPSLGLVTSSFLFLPWRRPDGWVRPLLSLGWTLNYEMLFYAVFALFAAFRARVAVPCVVGAVGLLAVLGWVFEPRPTAFAFWTDSLVLEFAFGAVLGSAAGRVRLAWPARAALVLAGLAGLLAAPAFPTLPECVGSGLPAAALVAGMALGVPRAPATPVGRAAVALGDWSYALYLMHPFPLRILTIVWRMLGLSGLWTYVGVAVAACVGVSWAVHRWVERPLTRAARRLLAV